MKDNRSRAEIMRDDDDRTRQWLRENGNPICFYCGEPYRHTSWAGKQSGYWSPNYPDCQCLRPATKGELLLLEKKLTAIRPARTDKVKK